VKKELICDNMKGRRRKLAKAVTLLTSVLEVPGSADVRDVSSGNGQDGVPGRPRPLHKICQIILLYTNQPTLAEATSTEKMEKQLRQPPRNMI